MDALVKLLSSWNVLGALAISTLASSAKRWWTFCLGWWQIR